MIQSQTRSGFERHSKVIGASSSDAGGDASSSNPGSAAAVAVPKARVQAPTVSEDEDSADGNSHVLVALIIFQDGSWVKMNISCELIYGEMDCLIFVSCKVFTTF